MSSRVNQQQSKKIESKKMGSKNGKPVLREEDISAFQETCGWSTEDIQKYFDNFLKDHPSGKIKPKEFKKIMKDVLPKKNAKAMQEHVFRVYDSNNDGVIDFEEFMTVYHMACQGSPEEILTRLFRIFDVNGDGKISEKEMKKLVKSMYGLLKEEDSKVAAEKFLVETAFKECDGDNDGYVTAEEFVQACLNKEEVTKLLTLKVVDIFVKTEKELEEGDAGSSSDSDEN